MRVIIASRIFSPEPSAASFMLEAFARSFRDAGHEVTVLTTRPPKGMRVTDIPDVDVKRAWVLRDATGYVRGYLPYLSFDIPLFFRLIFSRRADLYIVEPPPTSGAVMRLATTLLRRPYLYHVADVWSDAARMATSSSFVLRALRWVELFAWKGAGHRVAVSTGVADRMLELGVTAPTSVTGFGVDADVFRYESPDAGARPYFVYAGTYSEWHGADVLLRGFSMFAAGHPGYRLVFVGNGSERERLEALCSELGLTDVEFREPIDGGTLNGVLTDAVASLASLKPGQGYDYAFTTKVYSSIAAGCPVLFSGVGPTGSFIREHAVEHPLGVAVEYDAEAVALALARFAAEPLAPERRRELSTWARERFSLDTLARQIVTLGERTVAARVARRRP